MYVLLQKWGSREPIVVNSDMVVTVESTHYRPAACRINGDLLVAGELHDLVEQFNSRQGPGGEGLPAIRPEDSAFAKATKRLFNKDTMTPKRLVKKGKKNEQP